MARVANVDLNPSKQIGIALTSIFGIGQFSAKQILEKANISFSKRSKDITNEEAKRINSIIDNDYEVEGELRQKIFRNIKRLKDIRSYRGYRHKFNLPVRGQNTRTNAITRKGRSIAVGGLKRKLEKK